MKMVEMRMSFQVDGLNEITTWIAGFGDRITVLKPEALREHIRDKALRMLAACDRASRTETSSPVAPSIRRSSS